MLSVVLLSVVMLNVIKLNVIILNDYDTSRFMLHLNLKMIVRRLQKFL
jgi:hypothetical protein